MLQSLLSALLAAAPESPHAEPALAAFLEIPGVALLAGTAALVVARAEAARAPAWLSRAAVVLVAGSVAAYAGLHPAP